jgi:hypothetical protein
LGQTLYPQIWVNGKQCGAVAFKGRGFADESPPAEQGSQIRHVCAGKGILLRVVFAKPDTIEEEEESFHVGRDERRK